MYKFQKKINLSGTIELMSWMARPSRTWMGTTLGMGASQELKERRHILTPLSSLSWEFIPKSPAKYDTVSREKWYEHRPSPNFESWGGYQSFKDSEQ
jgi:hypothetical protein